MFTELCEEHRQLQDLVARFVDKELMPLEPRIIEREIRGEHPTLSPEEAAPLLAKCQELGLWALDVPEEFGGVNLPAVALTAVNEELWRTIVPFTFPPDSPNLHMLMAVATPEQKEKYLEPYAHGDAKSCIAVSEPGAGADPSGMTTKAELVGNVWVLNGRKIWVSRVPEADFIILMARVGGGKRREGITAFIASHTAPDDDPAITDGFGFGGHPRRIGPRAGFRDREAALCIAARIGLQVLGLLLRGRDRHQ